MIGLLASYFKMLKASFKPIQENIIFWKFYSGAPLRSTTEVINNFLNMGFVFFQLHRKETELFPVFNNGISQQFSRSAVFPPSLYEEICMVKVFHHSILDKIKKNQVNRCSRLQDLGAWKSPNFIRPGKLPTTVKVAKRKVGYINSVWIVDWQCTEQED